jgi:hypothetical protein
MRVDREKHESDIMEHVFLGVRPARGWRSSQVVSLAVRPWLSGLTVSAVQVSVVDDDDDAAPAAD